MRRTTRGAGSSGTAGAKWSSTRIRKNRATGRRSYRPRPPPPHPPPPPPPGRLNAQPRDQPLGVGQRQPGMPASRTGRAQLVARPRLVPPRRVSPSTGRQLRVDTPEQGTFPGVGGEDDREKTPG